MFEDGAEPFDFVVFCGVGGVVDAIGGGVARVDVGGAEQAVMVGGRVVAIDCVRCAGGGGGGRRVSPPCGVCGCPTLRVGHKGYRRNVDTRRLVSCVVPNGVCV